MDCRIRISAYLDGKGEGIHGHSQGLIASDIPYHMNVEWTKDQTLGFPSKQNMYNEWLKN